MAARRAAAALVQRLGGGARKSNGGFEAWQRAFAAWQPATAEYARPGFPASWSNRQDSREEFFPWSLQDMHKRPLLFSFADPKLDAESGEDEDDAIRMNVAETRKIVMHVNAVALNRRLNADPRDSFSFRDLVDVIKESGVAHTDEEAMRYTRALDEAGVVLIFRDNVYLHPERVAKLVSHALPFAVVPPNDPRRAELMKLEAEKASIDELAHTHVRRYLWTGLGALTCQAALFFRLTFWELSWDVMEPIAFFVTSAGLIGGYTYFLVTARDPSYQDFRQRLFYSKQMKLFKKKHFDYARYQLLRKQCQCLDPDDRRW